MCESTMKGFEVIDGVVPKRRTFITICVEGYDTSLREYDLKLALTKHFSTCGKILHIYVPRNYEKGLILQSYTFVRIAGEGALEKALKLNGSDVGGWRVFVKASDQEERIDPEWAAVGGEYYSSQREMVVTGYDTSLPEIDLQIGLSKHFSSCGEVVDVAILRNDSNEIWSRSIVSILGEDAVDKARELSGRDVGGWNITVVMATPPQNKIKLPRVSMCPFLPFKPKKMTEAESSLSLFEKKEEDEDYGVEFSLLGLGGD